MRPDWTMKPPRRPIRLYRKHTLEELTAMDTKIRDDPKNANTVSDSPWLYNKATLSLLDDIAWAVSYHLKDRRHREAGS